MTERLTMNIPASVAVAIAASALGHDDPTTHAAQVDLATEWHILHEAGIVSQPVPKAHRSLVRGQPEPTHNPFAGYRTSVQVGESIGIKPRTVRKHAVRLKVGTKVGHQRMFSTADVEAIRSVTHGGRPETRSTDVDWR